MNKVKSFFSRNLPLISGISLATGSIVMTGYFIRKSTIQSIKETRSQLDPSYAELLHYEKSQECPYSNNLDMVKNKMEAREIQKRLQEYEENEKMIRVSDPN